MRAQHQTTMTVHVRKLNRGMKQSTILKQAKQQKPIKIKQIESKSKKSKSKSKINRGTLDGPSAGFLIELLRKVACDLTSCVPSIRCRYDLYICDREPTIHARCQGVDLSARTVTARTRKSSS
jgi:hypothetical protein